MHPLKEITTGKYQSGQMGQTVNLLAYAFGGSNPSLPTTLESINFMILSFLLPSVNTPYLLPVYSGSVPKVGGVKKIGIQNDFLIGKYE